MAIYNEILSGRFNKGLQKFFAVKGNAPAPQLASDITSAVQLEDFTAVENRVVMQVDRFGVTTGVVAVAAQNGAVRFRNPANSNCIMVIERLIVAGIFAAADTPLLSFGPIATDLTTVLGLANQRLDGRGKPTGVMVVSRQNNAVALGSNAMQMALAVNGNADFVIDADGEFPISPGDAYQIQSVTVNQALTISIIWRERTLEAEEKL